jgi:hypothetical protein
MNLPARTPGTALVECELDSRKPTRIPFRISGPTREVVQFAIDKISSTLDAAFGGTAGYPNFTGPVRHQGYWCASGEIITDIYEEGVGQ